MNILVTVHYFDAVGWATAKVFDLSKCALTIPEIGQDVDKIWRRYGVVSPPEGSGQNPDRKTF